MKNAAFAVVLKSLRDVGFTRPQVNAILPGWWEPALVDSDAGLWETVVLLGRRLGLDASALRSGEVVAAEGISAPRYKHTVRVSAAQLGPATMVASAIARSILGAMPASQPPAPMSAKRIREKILAGNRDRVDFDGLLDFCWSGGIPVIPLPHLPRGLRKMDAAAINVGARPAIVIALKNDSKAWLSFLLAHELGHIELGHVPRDAALVEGSLRDSAEFDAESQFDLQEQEANIFAHALLGGTEAEAVISTWSADLPSVSLATTAMTSAEPLRTAPGHLVLRYAFRTRRWPDARQALNFLADDMDAQTSLVDRLTKEVDTAQLGEDLQDYIAQITGVAHRG